MLSLIVASLLVAQPVRIETLSGSKLTGSLRELTHEGILFVNVEGARQRLAIDQLLRVAPTVQSEDIVAGLKVSSQLIDGSLIRAREFTDAGGESKLLLDEDATIAIPTKSIRWVRWRPSGPPYGQPWRTLIAQDAQSDRIVIRRPGGVLDYLEGTIRGVDEKRVQFDFDGEALPVARERLEGVIYFHSAIPELPAAICQLRDTSGNSLELIKLELQEERLLFTTRAGVERQLPWRQVVRIDFSGGNLVYLSDLDPQSIRWTPFFAGDKVSDNARRLFYPRRDRGFHGESLSLRFPDEETPIREYAKGLSIQSRTEMIYRLPEGFQRFKAWAGIDMDVSPAGSVQLTVSGDKKVLYDAELRGGNPPEEIDVSVAGVRRLRVFVDFADNLAMGDQLNLCNARITK